MSNSDIPPASFINDIRTPGQFAGITFSKYKRANVKEQLIKSMVNGKVEPACYWAAELICAGHFMELWETVLHYIGKYIHLGNPKLASYLEMRYTIFRNIMSQGHYVSELDLRNSSKIRCLFAEIICILSLSNKKNSLEPIKINRAEEFDMTQMTDRLKAPNIQFIEDVFKKKDPKELFIPMNEFAYCISAEGSNMRNACYWIEWIIEFDILCRNKKEPTLCEKRSNIPVDKKLQCDIIWLIWDCLFERCSNIRNPFIEKVLQSIFKLFCIKYTSAASKRRRYLLYYAVALLTEPVSMAIELVQNKEIVQNVVSKIHEVYKQIKKLEQAPNTEYLFSGLDTKNNFEESVKRLELLNNVDFAIRPL
jgi:hypothetical protein